MNVLIRLTIILFMLSILSTCQLASAAEAVPCVKNAAGEKCLSNEEPYVEVPGKKKKPIILKKEPEQLKPRLRIEMITYEELLRQSVPKNSKSKKSSQ